MYISYQEQYYNILYNLLYNPIKKTKSRVGNIHSNFVEIIRVNLNKEFPLMELKKIKFSNILHELLWFIKGDTHIKYLLDNNCNIWNDDAYRYYLEKYKNKELISKEKFIELAKNGDSECGELDRIYGKQWRNFNNQTDQLQICIDKLLTNPDDRRILVTAHNPTDIENNIVGLPSCHNMFQFYTIPLNDYEISKLKNENKYYNNEIPKYKLNLWFNLRSNDFFLGQPYNMASYSLLLHIISNIVNMIPNEVVCTAIDCHLYELHFDAANEYIKRYNDIYSYMLNNNIKENLFICKSNIKINKKIKSIDDINHNDIELLNYNSMDYIKAPLLT